MFFAIKWHLRKGGMEGRRKEMAMDKHTLIIIQLILFEDFFSLFIFMFQSITLLVLGF